MTATTPSALHINDSGTCQTAGCDRDFTLYGDCTTDVRFVDFPRHGRIMRAVGPLSPMSILNINRPDMRAPDNLH
jgi:hypothetical protein